MNCQGVGARRMQHGGAREPRCAGEQHGGMLVQPNPRPCAQMQLIAPLASIRAVLPGSGCHGILRYGGERQRQARCPVLGEHRADHMPARSERRCIVRRKRSRNGANSASARIQLLAKVHPVGHSGGNLCNRLVASAVPTPYRAADRVAEDGGDRRILGFNWHGH